MNFNKLATELFEYIAKAPKVPLEEPRDFTKGEMGILVYLHFIKDGVTSGELSEELSVSTGRVATVLKSLENKGMIVRNSNLTDKRRVHVFITDTGKELVHEKHLEGIARMEKVLEKLGEEDAKEFIRLIKKVISQCRI